MSEVRKEYTTRESESKLLARAYEILLKDIRKNRALRLVRVVDWNDCGKETDGNDSPPIAEGMKNGNR